MTLLIKIKPIFFKFKRRKLRIFIYKLAWYLNIRDRKVVYLEIFSLI